MLRGLQRSGRGRADPMWRGQRTPALRLHLWQCTGAGDAFCAVRSVPAVVAMGHDVSITCDRGMKSLLAVRNVHLVEDSERGQRDQRDAVASNECPNDASGNLPSKVLIFSLKLLVKGLRTENLIGLLAKVDMFDLPGGGERVVL
jgi:hypothetical protein